MTKRITSRAMLCSTLAIATALLAGARPAAAQALIGTIDSSIGIGGVATGPGSTTITITSQQAVINWTANGTSANGTTTFSNSGSLTTFTGMSDFAVLNRVSPSVIGNSIFMGGDISSSVNGQVGGTVYFYSPNGIVIGGEANINVGSLGLTTLPISDVAGTWMSGFGTASPQVVFGTATNAASFVRTQSGDEGLIASSGAGHYVALVAPRVEHRGVIRTDSGAALVAASAATITFRTSALYDIVIGSGSSDGNGVVVDGGTIGRNDSAVGGDHRAYLVSVPANNAMTMLVQGGAGLGFDIAGSAGVEGNTVILSAGRNVFDGATVGPPLPPASATIDHASITSNLVMDTTASARISSGAGATTLSGNAALLAIDSIDVIADQHALIIGGSLSAVAVNIDNVGVGGTITLAARNGQTLDIGGNVDLSANGYGYAAFGDGLSGGSGTGGRITIEALGGALLDVAGSLDAHANGRGGSVDYSNGAGGAGVGGTIIANAGDGGSRIAIGGATSLSATGTGGAPVECGDCSNSGGNGTGGAITVAGSVVNGTAGVNRLTFSGGLSMDAAGRGGGGDVGTGAGAGGMAKLLSSDATVINVAGSLAMSVDGLGGSYLGSGAGNGGAGTGGQAQIGGYDVSGGAITIVAGNGSVILSARGVGGDAFNGSGVAGAGTGGRLAIDAKGAAITIDGDVTMNAPGSGGGSFSGSGGRGDGGNAFAHAYGDNLLVTGNLALAVQGQAGSGTIGGIGIGGNAVVAAELGSSLSVLNDVVLDASAQGGSGSDNIGGTGGAATGGNVSISSYSAGRVTLGEVSISGDARAGSGEVGGAATGGHGAIFSGGGAISIDGPLYGSSDARAGDSYDADGGNALGGRFEIVADGGSLTLRGRSQIFTTGFGGAAGGDAGSGGTGTGGAVDFHARGGGTLTSLDSLLGLADGLGGGAYNDGARAGNGVGGSARLSASGTNSTVDAQLHLLVSAEGFGGSPTCGECSAGAGGGDGIGGQATVSVGGGNGNRILIGNQLSLLATGVGSDGFSGPAGNGQGGWGRINLTDDGQLSVGGSLRIIASGSGGFDQSGAPAGTGVGGDAEINLGGGAGSRLSVGSSLAEVGRITLLDANGYGGWADATPSGSGGTGTGGWARIYGTGGSATFHGDVTIRAKGEGGNGNEGVGGAGVGGAGVGGRARLNADGAAYHLFAGLTVNADSRGGAGRDGGAASMRTIDNESNAAIFANNGGSIMVDGASVLSASATGGAGRFGGSGGAATGGRTVVIAGGLPSSVGTITLGALTAKSDAVGGLGDRGSSLLAGGNGGAATGGRVTVLAQSNIGGASRVSAGPSIFSATAIGANGGQGGDGLEGTAGGNGGIARGGSVFALADGGAARLSLGAVTSNVSAAGGRGGNGGSGSAGTGGLGGNGGGALSGFTVVGVDDGTTAPLAGAGAILTSLTATANLMGGNGGNGGGGSTAQGNGGNGGSTGLALIELIAVGGALTIGDVTAAGASNGGHGGSGAISGLGGDATTSSFYIVGRSATTNSAWRGSMALGDVTASMIATGGSGATDGLSIAHGGAFFNALNADLHLASYSVDIVAGDAIDPASLPDPIRVVNSDVTIDGAFRLVTDNIASVHVDTSSFDAASFTIAAPNYVSDISYGPPAATGTISADTISVQSTQDIILEAHLASVNSLTLNAAGLVDVGNLRAEGSLAGSDISVVAGGTISTGSITADRAVDVTAGGTLTTGSIAGRAHVALAAVGTISTGAIASLSGPISAFGGSAIATGNLTAGGGVLFDAAGAISTGTINATWIELFAIGNISLGDASTSQWIDIEAEGSLAAANMVAGEAIDLAAGGTLVAGNLAAGLVNANARAGADYNLSLLSATSIAVGTTAARDWIGMGTFGTLSAGNITSGNDVLLAADGAMTLGGIATGAGRRLLIAGADMALLGGAFDDGYDRSLVFGAIGTGAEAASGGAVSVTGSISTGRLDALVGGNFTTAALTATDSARATVAGTIAIEGAWAAPLTRIASTDIEIGATGGIGGARTDLLSTNATQLLVGDGLSGSGYALGNAEFGRLSATTINIIGRSDASAAIDTLIGTLGLTGRSGGSEVVIATANGIEPAGNLRVVGAVGGSGYEANDELVLAAGRVEVDATAGGVSLQASGGAPGGVLTLAGQRVHVAETAILDLLAADPGYVGRDQALATAPAVQRPDGVVRAGEIYVELINPAGQSSAAVTAAAATAYSVLVQNMGTQATPAGFTATYAEIISPEGASPGSIDMVVNGQLVTVGGTLTGVAVRDALMADDDPARFTALSRINGCALTGACVLRQEPPIRDPHPDISTEIQLIGAPSADDVLFGNEEAIEDNEEDGGEDSASSPIAPPVPLFNTKPLEQKGDTDEPVSGGGNPALIGNGPAQGVK